LIRLRQQYGSTTTDIITSLHGEKFAGIKIKQKVTTGFPRIGCHNYFVKAHISKLQPWSSCHPIQLRTANIATTTIDF
jgi:hypothetical protein